ncbi:MAG: hypothetical protein PW788_07410 [Micavibrio sp.]|nr:hypothetical protein [Micavibrio sp.]
MGWEQAQGDFVESDVLEWVEGIWPRNKYRRKKSKPWGKQKVTAQIASIDGDFVKLVVLKASIVENVIGSELKPHKTGTTINKKKATLLRSNPERLQWSEEDVRAALLAQHSAIL